MVTAQYWVRNSWKSHAMEFVTFCCCKTRPARRVIRANHKTALSKNYFTQCIRFGFWLPTNWIQPCVSAAVWLAELKSGFVHDWIVVVAINKQTNFQPDSSMTLSDSSSIAYPRLWNFMLQHWENFVSLSQNSLNFWGLNTYHFNLR